MNIDKLFLDSLYKLESKEKTLNTHLVTQKDKFTTSLQLNKKNLNTIETILKEVNQDIKDLNTKLKETITILKNAIVGERNMTGYIYSTNIPISTNYTSKENTALVKEGIVFGTTINSRIDEGTLLPISVLTHYDTNITNTSKYIENILLNTVGKNVIELRLNVEKYIGNYLIINFNDFQVVELLENDNVLVEKTLIKHKTIPINSTSITIRFHSKNNKPIKIDSILSTNKIYTETVVFESTPISINKQLEYLSLDICDNNGIDAVSINYYLKINNKDYEIISNTSNKIKEYQNIIKTNKDNLLKFDEVKGSKYKEDFYKFPLSFPTAPSGYTTEIYINNNKQINTGELYFIVPKDTLIVKEDLLLQINDSLYIDNKLVTENTYLLTKGLHSIVTTNTSNEVSTINYEVLSNTSSQIFISKIEKEIIEDSSTYYIKLSNLDLLPAYNLLKDDNEYSIFIPNNKSVEYIDTIQLKAELKSNDKKTCPFISKIIVRGI